jgi:hypothetical protein
LPVNFSINFHTIVPKIWEELFLEIFRSFRNFQEFLEFLKIISGILECYSQKFLVFLKIFKNLRSASEVLIIKYSKKNYKFWEFL